jgi:hypothetical protein
MAKRTRKHPMPELSGVDLYVDLKVVVLRDAVDLAELMVFINALIAWSGAGWKVVPNAPGGTTVFNGAPWPTGEDGYGDRRVGFRMRSGVR